MVTTIEALQTPKIASNEYTDYLAEETGLTDVRDIIASMTQEERQEYSDRLNAEIADRQELLGHIADYEHYHD